MAIESESRGSKLTVVPSARSSRIAGILFADVVGFSTLSDLEVVRFYSAGSPPPVTLPAPPKSGSKVKIKLEDIPKDD